MSVKELLQVNRAETQIIVRYQRKHCLKVLIKTSQKVLTSDSADDKINKSCEGNRFTHKQMAL